jgi:Na+/phosphate symporter
MNNEKTEKLTKDWMADSLLTLDNPQFEAIVMKQISLEYEKKKRRQQVRSFILVFFGIEFLIFSLIWILLVWYPGYQYFVTAMGNSLSIFHTLGNLVIQYDYIILSFIFVTIMEVVMKKSQKIYVN